MVTVHSENRVDLILHKYLEFSKKQMASQVALVVKNPPANAGDRLKFNPWVEKIPWRRKR